jgi:hypothetical protein
MSVISCAVAVIGVRAKAQRPIADINFTSVLICFLSQDFA